MFYDKWDKNAFLEDLTLETLKLIAGQFDGSSFHPIFSNFIRPYLEYWNIVFTPSLLKDKDT